MPVNKIEYIVRATSEHEKIRLAPCGSTTVAYVSRFGHHLTSFIPGPTQLKRIRDREKGEIFIRRGQIERAQRLRCPAQLGRAKKRRRR